MQRTWTDRIKTISKYAIIVFAIALFIAFDQSTKTYIKNLSETTSWKDTDVIKDFFKITCVYNSGAAWSFLANKSWGQLFFKILTPIALVGFVVFFIYALKKKYKTLSIGLALIISGTIGNFIDRLRYDFVVDFLSFVFGDYKFPVFNIADSYMTIGIVLLLTHFLFLDKNAIFKKNGKKDIQDS